MRRMKNGILRPDEGFDIIVNGVDRSFRDRKEVAFASARYLKQRNPKDIIEIRIRATGERIVMLEDGRTG
jgi:hypothetical protein